MTNFKKQIVSAAAAGAMFLNLATPVLANEYVISGNSAGSENFVNVTQNNTTVVTQDNNATVTNTVNADADTGDNGASFNNGGDVVINTGKAEVTTLIGNSLNTNTADLDCCAAGNTDAKVSNNGAFSDNVLDLVNNNVTVLDQNNEADVDNNVDAEAETGENRANWNNGGSVTVNTGKAEVYTELSTAANVNSARIGNGLLGSNNSSASFEISGNSAGSENYITATLSRVTTVAQDNGADVDNVVEAEAESGENDAKFNNGGDVVIDTGNAEVVSVVDNALNFNHADVDCGCTLGNFGGLVKIAGNGATFHGDANTIGLNLASLQTIGQGNGSTIDNLLGDDEELEAETGENRSNWNNGGDNTDPSIHTGNAYIGTSVSNSGGVNVVGELPFDFPELPEVEYSFNMAFLWGFLGLSN